MLQRSYQKGRKGYHNLGRANGHDTDMDESYHGPQGCLTRGDKHGCKMIDTCRS